MAKLTIKQKRFVDLLLTDPDMNQTKAFIGAGYSPTGADANSSILMVNHSIQEYLQKGMKERQKRLAKQEKGNDYDQDEVIDWLQTIRVNAMPTDEEKVHPAMLRVALDASEKLGKHIGMWPNKIEHNVNNFTAADREGACLYELPVAEYVERKQAGTLPPVPEVPGPRVH